MISKVEAGVFISQGQLFRGDLLLRSVERLFVLIHIVQIIKTQIFPPVNTWMATDDLVEWWKRFPLHSFPPLGGLTVPGSKGRRGWCAGPRSLQRTMGAGLVGAGHGLAVVEGLSHLCLFLVSGQQAGEE